MPRANTFPAAVDVGQAAGALLRGEIIAYPTEAVWGLGCNPFNEQAVMQLLRLKERQVDKGLILVAESLEQIQPYLAAGLSTQQLAPMVTPSAQPVTWLVPFKTDALPRWITGNHSRLAVRISQHPVVRALCHAAHMPIVSTSANPAGFEPATSMAGVREWFGDKVLICAGETGRSARPSTIRDLLTGVVIRE